MNELAKKKLQEAAEYQQRAQEKKSEEKHTRKNNNIINIVIKERKCVADKYCIVLLHMHAKWKPHTHQPHISDDNRQ